MLTGEAVSFRCRREAAKKSIVLTKNLRAADSMLASIADPHRAPEIVWPSAKGSADGAFMMALERT